MSGAVAQREPSMEGEMPPFCVPCTNSWLRYQREVMGKLDENSNDLRDLRKAVEEIRMDHANQKGVMAGIGIAAGTVGAIIASVIGIVIKGLK